MNIVPGKTDVHDVRVPRKQLSLGKYRGGRGRIVPMNYTKLPSICCIRIFLEVFRINRWITMLSDGKRNLRIRWGGMQGEKKTWIKIGV